MQFFIMHKVGYYKNEWKCELYEDITKSLIKFITSHISFQEKSDYLFDKIW